MLETLLQGSRLEKIETTRATAGKSIAVWGTQGSGKSVIALNLAMEIALLGHRVLLADLDTKAPSLSAYLGNPADKSTLTTALRMAGQGRLGAEQILEITEPLDCDGVALRFLAGLRSPVRWIEVDQHKLTGLLEATMQNFDFAIFDLASDAESGLVRADATSSRNLATEFMTSRCDKTLAVFQPDPIGVNRLIWSLQEFAGEPYVIANGYRNSVLGKNYRSQISQVLERFGQTKVEMWIPWDQTAFDAGMLRGQPLWLANRGSKARESLRHLAQQLLELDY